MIQLILIMTLARTVPLLTSPLPQNFTGIEVLNVYFYKCDFENNYGIVYQATIYYISARLCHSVSPPPLLTFGHVASQLNSYTQRTEYFLLFAYVTHRSHKRHLRTRDSNWKYHYNITRKFFTKSRRILFKFSRRMLWL